MYQMLEKSLSEYDRGSIGMKRLSKLSGLLFNELGLLIQEKDVEPPISTLIDNKTDEIREKFKTYDNFKRKKSFKQTSPEFQGEKHITN